MKTYQIRLWVSNLESIYSQAKSAKSIKSFFLAVYDYVQYILTTDGLIQLSDTFSVQKEADQAVDEQDKEGLHRLERVKETRVWYAWEQMRLFYNVYSDVESILEAKSNNERWLDLSNFDQMKIELVKIQKNIADDQMQVFNQDKYLNFLHKIHRQLLNEIDHFEKLNKLDKSDHHYIFDENTSTIIIDGKERHFKSETKKISLLKLLIENSGKVYFGEVAEELEGIVINEDIGKIKNTYYEACRNLDLSFGKIGVTDFLDFNGTWARINPIYNKLSK